MAGNDAKWLRLAQSRKFADAARSLECDESEEQFDAALEKSGLISRRREAPAKPRAALTL
jgi:hypothetical protein